MRTVNALECDVEVADQIAIAVARDSLSERIFDLAGEERFYAAKIWFSDSSNVFIQTQRNRLARWMNYDSNHPSIAWSYLARWWQDEYLEHIRS